MKKKLYKSVLSFLLVLVITLSVIPFSAFAEEVPELGAIDESFVIDDLAKFGIDITEYQKDTSATHCRMLKFLEYGYDYYASTVSYGLYVYLWNPSGKAIDVDSSKNMIQMQSKKTVSDEGSGWKKYGLELCSVSDVQGYENVFYKFKVKGIYALQSNLIRDARRYDISGVEVLFEGDQTATEFNVGGEYTFTGFMPYCNPQRNAKNSLTETVTDRTTIEIELHPVSWKTQTSDKGSGYQYELSSVYFSVPNDIIRDYGNSEDATKGLVQIDGVFEEYKINGLVTPYITYVYDMVYPYLGRTDSDNIPFGYFGNCSFSNLTNLYSDGVQFNMDDTLKFLYTKTIPKLCSVFSYEAGAFEGLSAEKFQDGLYAIIEDKGEFYFLPDVDQGSKLGHQEYSVKSGEDLAEQISTYASVNRSWWIAAMKGEANLIIKDESYSDISSIQIIPNNLGDLALTDEAIAAKYYLQESEVSGLQSFAASEALKDKTTYMMRFAVRDYFCVPVYFENGSGQVYEEKEGNYYFEKTVFRNLDVLSFTWENQYAQRTTLPVVCSPIDHFGSVTPSRNPGVLGAIGDAFSNVGSDFSDFFKSLSSIKLWILIFGTIIIVAIVLFVFDKLGIPLGSILSGAGKVIGAVGRGAAKVAGGVGRGVSGIFSSAERRRERQDERDRRDRAETRQDRLDREASEDRARSRSRQDRLDREASEDRARSRSRQDRLDREAEIDADFKRRKDFVDLNLRARDDQRKQENHDHNKENWE